MKAFEDANGLRCGGMLVYIVMTELAVLHKDPMKLLAGVYEFQVEVAGYEGTKQSLIREMENLKEVRKGVFDSAHGECPRP
jgi:hypothetical protein